MEIDEYLKSYTKKKGKLVFDRGTLLKIIKHFKNYGHKVIVKDNRLTLDSVDFKSKIILRDDQKPAVKAILKYEQGIVIGPCSWGKTILMLQAIAISKQTTLIIVWSTLHQKQWIGEINKFFIIFD